MNSQLLLEVKGLKTYFHTDDGIIKAVDGVSFTIERGETLGIVGESGCGKSVMAQSLMQLVSRPHGRVEAGEILYRLSNGVEVDIAQMAHNSKEIRSIRGSEIAMIFQEPMISLNPVQTIGQQIMEMISQHNPSKPKSQVRNRAIEMLGQVGIADPHVKVDQYPHEFSGGMRQRAIIAMALSCSPNLLIADEPTTALDVTVEAQILELMKDLQSDLGMSIMIITHDLGVIGEMADKVIVMYAGKIMEQAVTSVLFERPTHPYTIGLLNSRPSIGRKESLRPIEGTVPDMRYLPEGCLFAPRCPYAVDICHRREPDFYPIGESHYSKCWLYAGKEGQSA